jgi:hypothetical protein
VRGRGRRRGGSRAGRSLRGEPDLPLSELLDLLAQLGDPPAELGVGRRSCRRTFPLELGHAHAEVRELVGETKAFRLHCERAHLRDLACLPLDPVEQLADERHEELLGSAALLQIGRGGGAGQEQGTRVELRGSVRALGEQPGAHELRAGDPPAAVPDERPQGAALDPTGDSLAAEAGQLGRFADRVRPHEPLIVPIPPGRGQSYPEAGETGLGRGRDGASV